MTVHDASLTSPSAAPGEPATFSFVTPAGIRIACETWGKGPPLVLIHGAFSDQRTNWGCVKPLLEPHFSAYAMARRGRGGTDATTAHELEDEVEDAVALIRRIGPPVFLLGHSYGAHVALAAAARVPDLVRRLVLYEPPWPHLCDEDALAPLQALAEAGNWDGFATTFFRDLLAMPREEVEALRASADWSWIVADAPASLRDMRAVAGYHFDAGDYRGLAVPVLLQVGSESPADFYVTDALASVLPDATVDSLAGQGHDAVITGPVQFAESVRRFLLA
jgi:pimeloyl-ACP methyl ester carboxylesterase